jgi:hypothetical protein
VAGIMASARDGVPTPSIPEMGRFWAAMKSSLTNLSEGRQTSRAGAGRGGAPVRRRDGLAMTRRHAGPRNAAPLRAGGPPDGLRQPPRCSTP